MHSFALLALALSAVRPAPLPAEVRVLLVRHAEAGTEPSENPGLSDAGRERAACIQKLLAGEKLTHVMSSPLRRTQETAAAIATAHGVAPVTRDPLPAAALASELSVLPPGSVALVVGHTNTLPALVEALGGKLGGLTAEGGQPSIPRDQHDRVIRIRLRAGEAGGPARLVDLEEASQGCNASTR